MSMQSAGFVLSLANHRDSTSFGPQILPVTYNKTLALAIPNLSFYHLFYRVLVLQDALRKKNATHISETLHATSFWSNSQ